MKWKAKPIKYWKQGEMRTIQRFAFLPQRLDNDEIIWMEWYSEQQEYHQPCMIGDITFPSEWWKVKRWQ